jgi:hypothetical protein
MVLGAVKNKEEKWRLRKERTQRGRIARGSGQIAWRLRLCGTALNFKMAMVNDFISQEDVAIREI